MKKRWLLLLPLLGVYLLGMFIDVMEADAAQYATMSLEMLQTGNYLELYHRGHDYIDKPPLIFWTAALSFKLFGPSNFAYKLPSVLFTLLGLFGTYRLGNLLYGARVGFYATLLLASCQAWFTINQDVRTDTILAACTIVAIWQLAEFSIHQRTIHVIFAGLAIAGAMLMKGPIGLMVPALAIGTDYALKRQWKMLFRWQWLLLAAIVLVCLLPMLYGLYSQFDASDGKVTYNGTITSGLQFYFWTQSFGRLTGESIWKNDTGPFFFAHTFLWAFLPWSVLFVVAFFKRLKKIVWSRFLIKDSSEALTIGGILFPAIAFSLSQYKLPHYIFVFFPLAAILSGKFLSDVIKKSPGVRVFAAFRITHAIISLLLLALGLFIGAVCFPLYSIPIAVTTIVGLFLTVFFIFYKGSPFQALVLPALIAITTFNFLMNAHVYLQLLNYQSPGKASQMIRSDTREKHRLIGFRSTSYSMDFYYRQAVPNIDSVGDLIKTYGDQTMWVFTHDEGYDELRKAGINILQKKTMEDFHVSMLTMKFLNPKTRPEAIRHRYLLLVKIQG